MGAPNKLISGEKWIADNTGNILGYQNDRGQFVQIPRLSADGLSLMDGDGNLVKSRAIGKVPSRILKRGTDLVGVGVSNSGTAATVTVDAASPFGRPAIKIAMPAGNVYTEITLTGLGIANFDGHIAWRIWVEDYTAVKQLIAYAGTASYTQLWQSTHSINNSDKNRLNGEQIVVVGPTSNNSTATFVVGTDTMDSTKIRISPEAAGANMWVETIMIPSKGRTTHVITHDDCSKTWIDNCLPLLADVGLTATFAIETDVLNTNSALYLSSSQVAQLAAAGHQISSHNHSNTSYNDGMSGTQTAAQYTTDFNAAVAILSGILGSNVDTSYHPWVQGKVNQALITPMRAAGIIIARGTEPGHNMPQLGMGMHAMRLKVQSLHTLSTAQIDQIIADSKKYGTTVIWMVHEVNIGGVGVETSRAIYEYLVNAIAREKANGAIHMTAAQLALELQSERLMAASLL